MFIPPDFIRSVIDTADLAHIVGGRVKLKKSGRNYSGLCPFHNEKTPSFSVVPDKGFYHCFGCGAHGNALDFMMKHEGKDFVVAVEELAAMLGMTVPQTARENREGETTPLADITAALKAALSLWRKSLADSDDAKNYLKNRGLKADTVNRFGLGYAPDSWGTLRDGLAKEDVGLLVRAGLLRESAKSREGVGGGESGKYYDYFRSRIIFPVFDERSRLCGFGGRVLNDDEPKYLNSPETPQFSKRRLLFGLAQARETARKKNRLLITEGYMDAIMLSQAGFAESVATMGTAVTMQQMEKALRVADNIIFAFDGDEAGRRAVGKALEGLLPALADGVSAFFLFLPAGEDPDSFVRRHGAAAFEEKIAAAPSLQKYLPDWLLQLTPLGSEEGKASAALKEGERLLRLINPARAPYLKKLLAQHLAERFGVPQKTVLQAVARQTPRRGRANYKMRPESRLFNFLCCISVRPELVNTLKENIPLPGDDEAAKIIAGVLSDLNKEMDVERSNVARMLDDEGLKSLAEQVRESVKRRFSVNKKIEEDFELLTGALWEEHDKRTGSERKQWLDKINLGKV